MNDSVKDPILRAQKNDRKTQKVTVDKLKLSHAWQEMNEQQKLKAINNAKNVVLKKRFRQRLSGKIIQ